jgi:prolyl oligopeptidase
MIADRLIVFSTRDAAPRVRIHALSGEVERDLPLPPLTTVWGPSVGSPGFGGRATDREAYFVATGVADPGSVYRLDPRTGRTDLFLRPSFGFDPGAFVGRQVFYTGKDGTRIPMFIAHHRDVRPDGSRPVFMYGYGAFGWAAFPWFQPQILAWMENGGVYAIPCLRGGGEYGEAWHEAAIRERKQTSVDDYIAAAEWLVANEYAAPRKVVANGGSASGVIAAAALIQRPALFGAAVIDIPALDMVRYDRHTGAASWIPEFGSTASVVEFRALRALSPYHNLDPRVCYPPTLVLAGEKDDIAVPSHAYKFIAALQASQPCASRALLLVAWGAGHTFGSSNEASAENWSRQLAFVSAAVGLDPLPSTRSSAP